MALNRRPEPPDEQRRVGAPVRRLDLGQCGRAAVRFQCDQLGNPVCRDTDVADACLGQQVLADSGASEDAGKEGSMSDWKTLSAELQRMRDELKLKIHLGSREAQDRWAELEARWARFEAEARLRQTSREVGAALELLGSELKDGYERLRKAL